MKKLVAMLAVTSVLFLNVHTSRATVLTFEVTSDSAVGGTIFDTTFSGYGDLVGSATVAGPMVSGNPTTFHYGDPNTPNLEVAYSEVGASVYRHVLQSGGPWTDQVDQISGRSGNVFYIDFTSPSGYVNNGTGYGINVSSFTFEPWTHFGDLNFAGTANIPWFLRKDTHDTGEVLASGVTTITLSDVTFDVDVPVSTGMVGYYAGPVVLEIHLADQLNPYPDGNVAIDDVTFTQQQLPEPASAGLLALGGALMLRRRRAC